MSSTLALFSTVMLMSICPSISHQQRVLPPMHTVRRSSNLLNTIPRNYKTCHPPNKLSSCKLSFLAAPRFWRRRHCRMHSVDVSLDKSRLDMQEMQVGSPPLDPYDILRDLQKIPDHFARPIIPMPTHLSPTSLELFHSCPQAFFFIHILKLSPDPPITPALARGILCHTALEEIFDLRPAERSLTNLENLFRRGWKKKRGNREEQKVFTPEFAGDTINRGQTSGKQDEAYDTLFRTSLDQSNVYDIDAEVEWGKSCLKLLENYYELEDPTKILPPNPLTREMWVHARFDSNTQLHKQDRNLLDESFVVRGKIDRIDVSLDERTGKLQLQIIDYKTGKKPHFKYSQAVNERIQNEQFWKMKVYALMLWKMILQTDNGIMSRSVEAVFDSGDQTQQFKYRLPWELQQKMLQLLGRHYDSNKEIQWSKIVELLPLRLFYLTSHPDDASANGLPDETGPTGKASFLEIDVGGSNLSRFHSMLEQTEQEVQAIRREIKSLVEMQDPTAFRHCDSNWCNCHEIRRRFRRGSVWSSA